MGEKLIDIYDKMLLTRKFEETIAHLFAKGVMHGTTHLYVGEEAVAAGVCGALQPQDVIAGTHRSHGHCISKGMDIKAMMAEMQGKAQGSCKGKGGSMHIADLDKGNLGSNGIVGGGIPLAVGAALAVKMRGEDRIVACFFGDGATNEGSFHESLNLASIWKLPVLFVCEDNHYGLSMSRRRAMNIDDISVRAQSYGMMSQRTDGNDAVEVYRKAVQARRDVREHGPMLLVCDTYRLLGHSKSDKNVYRTQQEIEQWKAKDPIDRMKRYLLDNKLLTEDTEANMRKCAEQTVNDALLYAQSCEYPDAGAVREDVYA